MSGKCYVFYVWVYISLVLLNKGKGYILHYSVTKKKYEKGHVTTALLLAAGIGSRLYPLTATEPKCLTIVSGISILERMISGLKKHGFKRLVIVTGYLENHIRDYLGDQAGEIKIEYIFSPLYNQTNNIYSLWMARKVINEPFLLLESDLVFDETLLGDMLYPDRIAVAKMQPWMNGTFVTVDPVQQVKAICPGCSDSNGDIKYKTVNMYSISLHSWQGIIKRLDEYISEGKVNEYYEVIFAEMISEGSLDFTVISFDRKPWYEIDTLEDLREAEKLFPMSNFESERAVAFSNPSLNMELSIAVK